MSEDKKKEELKNQSNRRVGRMADPEKNKEAWEQKAQDASGRDWTKPRRPTLKDGEV